MDQLKQKVEDYLNQVELERQCKQRNRELAIVRYSRKIKDRLAKLDFKETRTGTLKRQQFYRARLRTLARTVTMELRNTVSFKEGSTNWLGLQSKIEHVKARMRHAQSKADHYRYLMYRKPRLTRYFKDADYKIKWVNDGKGNMVEVRAKLDDDQAVWVRPSTFHKVRGVTKEQIEAQKPINRDKYFHWSNKINILLDDLDYYEAMEEVLRDKIYNRMMSYDIKIRKDGEFYVPRKLNTRSR